MLESLPSGLFDAMLTLSKPEDQFKSFVQLYTNVSQDTIDKACFSHKGHRFSYLVGWGIVGEC